MIDDMGIGVSDLDAGARFYSACLAPLGYGKITEVTPEQTGHYHGIGYGRDGKPDFWIGNSTPVTRAIHIAFTAPDRASVDAFYEAALAQGGRDNGPPGIRAHYHPDYYGAFIIDPDGNNVEAVCHAPE